MTSEPKNTHESFTTVVKPMDRNSFPMRLWEKAKTLGTWNPSDIDLSQDRADWEALAEDEKDMLLRVLAQFQAGEEAVTMDLLPLMETLALEGKIEEEIFLTSFLWEEAKHVDFFRRYLDEVAQYGEDLSGYLDGGAYGKVFYEELPKAMGRLRTDRSRAAQVEASTVYNMIVEGVLAETGYHIYYEIIDRRKILPGLKKAIALVQRDESRHIAFGVYLLSRLISEEPEMFEVIQKTMMRMQPLTQEIIMEVFELYDEKAVPFDLKVEEMQSFAASRFASRMERIMQAKSGLKEDEMKVEA